MRAYCKGEARDERSAPTRIAGGSVVQRHPAGDQFAAQRTIGNQAVVRSRGAATGDPLPYRAEMERRFDADFSGVQASLGRARELRTLGAAAATTGDRVVFADANPGKQVVAHELTHVLQQRAGLVGGGPAVDPDRGLEAEAVAVASRVAHGQPAAVASVRGAAAAGAASVAVQRAPDVKLALPWSDAISVRQFGDHPVFGIQLPDGMVVVKAQSSVTSAREIFANTLAGRLLSGSKASDMRLLTPEEENELRVAIPNVEGGEVMAGVIEHNTSMMVMEFMTGQDLGEAGELFKDEPEGPLTEGGVARTSNLGELYAYNFFIVGSDRFDHPALDGISGGVRNDNIRLDTESDKMHTMDTSIRDSLKYGLGNDVAATARRIQADLSPLIDNLIFDQTGGATLVRTLAAQMSIGDIGDEGHAALREGFGRGLASIGDSDADFGEILAAVAPMDVLEDSQFFSARDSRGEGYVEFLGYMRQFFAEKARMFEAANEARTEDDNAGILGVVRAATIVGVGEPLARPDVQMLKRLDRNPAKRQGGKDGKTLRRGTWSAGLTRIETDKNSAVAEKRVPLARAREILDNVIQTGVAMLAVPDAGLREDYCRMAAKVVLRIRGKITRPG
jgi:hypothetical protein